MTKKKLKKCPVCGAVMYQFAPGIRCLDCEMKQAQDERERNRVKTLAWAAYHLEHGERLSLGEVAAMADAMGMSYGAYSLQLSQQKHNAATNCHIIALYLHFTTECGILSIAGGL